MSSTKVWLTKAGGCILASNGSRIPKKELNYILEIIPLFYVKILSKWIESYGEDSIKFYC